MKMNEFTAMLEEVLEMDPGTITAAAAFRELPGWNSMAMLGFMALMDESFGISVSPKEIEACVKVADLAALAGGKVQ